VRKERLFHSALQMSVPISERLNVFWVKRYQ
jgi:hypothetical protein